MRQDLPSRSQSQFFLSYHINVQRVRSLSCSFYSDTVYNLHFYFLIFYNLQLFRTSSKYTIDLLFFNFALFIIKCKKYNYFTIFLHKSNPLVYTDLVFSNTRSNLRALKTLHLSPWLPTPERMISSTTLATKTFLKVFIDFFILN